MALAAQSKRGSDAGLRLAVALVAACGALAPSPARAEGDNAEAAAEALFRDAKKLMAQGNDAAACAKLAESQRLDPGTGTLLMLAICHERTGRMASARNELRDALAHAQAEQRADREELARKHLALVEPHLARVLLHVPERNAAVPGFEVRRDGEIVAPSTWPVAVALDAGPHVFEAFVAGKRIFTQTVLLGADAEEQEVTVPPLAAQGASVAAPVPSSAPVHAVDVDAAAPSARKGAGTSPMRGGAYVAFAATLGAAAVGSFFGIRAMNASADAHRLCPAYPCGGNAEQAQSTAHEAALISNIAFAAAGGTALLGLGLLVFDASAPSPVGGRTGASSATAQARPLGVAVEWKGVW